MIRKFLKKTVLVGFSTLTVLGTLAGTTSMVAYASEQPVALLAEENDIVPHSDIIEYRYKVINGDLYRRLYNYTQEYWIGEWELLHKA